MEYIGFSNPFLAVKHRSEHGGWFFIPEDNSEIIWFHISITPGQICRHRATRGMNGAITTHL